MRYVPPADAIDRLTEFLDSSSRVYVTKGPPGCGKTRLMHYLADALATKADFQLHSVDSWDTRHFNLAGEILQYASIPRGDDPPLTLETISVSLREQCLIVVDGIKTARRGKPARGRNRPWRYWQTLHKAKPRISSPPSSLLARLMSHWPKAGMRTTDPPFNY